MRLRSHSTTNQVVPFALPRLPQELVDLVLDELQDDRLTLLACCLTCRAWFSRTRVHLFRYITLANAVGSSAFEKLLRQSPYLANYVRRVVIIKSHYRVNLVDREMPRLLAKLPRVQQLKVVYWRTSLSNRARSQLSTFCTEIKTLYLKHVKIFRGDLVRLVLACPQLRSLRVSLVQVKNDTNKSTFVPLPSAVFQIDTLSLHDYHYMGAARILLDALHNPRIRRLEVRADDFSAPTYAAYMLEKAGSHLEHFIFMWGNARQAKYRDSPWANSITLAHNPHLSTLSIYSTALCASLVWQHSWLETMDEIPFWLSLIQPLHVHLQQICISLTAVEVMPAHGDAIEWHSGEIDDHLVRIAQMRPQLQVRFQVYDEQRDEQRFEELLDAITSRLPKYTAHHGRLGIISGGEWKEDFEFGEGFVGHLRERWLSG